MLHSAHNAAKYVGFLPNKIKQNKKHANLNFHKPSIYFEKQEKESFFIQRKLISMYKRTCKKLYLSQLSYLISLVKNRGTVKIIAPVLKIVDKYPIIISITRKRNLKMPVGAKKS
jgi:hypothetical protein